MTLRTTFPAMVAMVVLVVGWTWGNADGSRQTVAQEENAEAAPAHEHTDIAVINVARIFKNHGEFNRRLELMRREVRELDKQVAVRQAEIDSVKRKLQASKPGSTEHDKTQLLLVRLQTELKLFGERHKQQLLKQEAQLYSDIYGQITESVKKHAQENGIRIVLRTYNDTLDPNNPKSILGALNRMVVYQEGLDITDEILKRMNVDDSGDSPT